MNMDDNINNEKEILDLYNNNNINLYINQNEMIGWIGNYYRDIEKNYNKMEEYYLMAIEKIGDKQAMNNLGCYYYNTQNYTNAQKYFNMALNNNNFVALNNLGAYYQNIEKDYDKMKKYYLMAIEKNNSDSMYNLGIYYMTIEKDYKIASKYIQMAYNGGNKKAVDLLHKIAHKKMESCSN
jgi:TPR repeat protein